MEKIKKLLAEYEIRFHNTEEIIITENIPFSMVNSGTFEPKVASNIIWNKNGIAYKDGKWATAKITQKPEKWVVEKDENHPVWEKFKEMSIWRNFDRVFQTYYSDDKSSTILLDFRGYQYLTLDQWAEFYLPKVDFSIHNEEDWFFVMLKNKRKFLIKGKLNNDYLIFSLIPNEMYPEGHFINKDNIIEFRRPTDEEMNVLYEKHPEFAPPKRGGNIGDWGAFWNDGEDIGNAVVDIFSGMYGARYRSKNHGTWENFYVFIPEIQKLISEEMPKIKKYK